MRILISLWILLICFSAFSQTTSILTRDVNLGGFRGAESWEIQNTELDSSVLLTYKFDSEIEKSIVNNAIQLSKLNINGEYLNNRKDSIWTYKKSKYLLDDLRLNDSKSLSLGFKINGIEDKYNFRFGNNAFDGKMNWIQTKIVEGQKERPAIVAIMEFVNDTVVGDFIFEFATHKIRGSTNESGFLEGTIELLYLDGNQTIYENRTYDDGFLIHLVKLDVASKDTILNLVYHDVIDQLFQIRKNKENSKFTPSENYFGVNFDNGYKRTDSRISEQAKGNEILRSNLLFADSIHNVLSSPIKNNIVLKLTRRFKFKYDSNEEALVESSLLFAKNLKNEIEERMSYPKVVLRKNTSESIYKQYETAQYQISKLDAIIKVLQRIESGYFDYINRHEYYSGGVQGLNSEDTIFYQFFEKKSYIPFSMSVYVDDPHSLLADIEKYLKELKMKSDDIFTDIEESLSVYENQEKIDSLDIIITKQKEKINQKYRFSEIDKRSDKSVIDFSLRVLESINDRMLSGLEAKYLYNSLPQDQMIQLGEDLICYYDFFVKNKSYLDRIGVMKKIWNDSLFTVYRDNPFDYRELETKILEGLQSSSNILLSHYANQLLNVKTCSQLEAEILKIKNLNDRLLYLVDNQQLDNVQQLNKTLRRERVPSRIERILEL
jgi:hypothetical protein